MAAPVGTTGLARPPIPLPAPGAPVHVGCAASPPHLRLLRRVMDGALARRLGATLCVIGAFLCAASQAAADDTVFVEVTVNDGGGQDRILVTYPRAVGRREAILDFQNLARWGKWPPAVPEEEGAFDIIRGCDTYRSASASSSMIATPGGELRWEVFAFAFRRFSAVHVTFDIGTPFYYKGPLGDLSNQAIRVRALAVPEENLYSFCCEIVDSAVIDPTQFTEGLAVRAGDHGRPASAPGLWERTRSAPGPVVALLVVCGALLATSTFLLVSAARDRRRAAR